MLDTKIQQIAAITGATSAVIVLTLSLVIPHESKRNKAYLDPVGVVTACYGHTATAKLGQTYTDDECFELLAKDLNPVFAAIKRYVKVPLSNEIEAALASFIFNVGTRNFRNSTLLKELNKGNYEAACAQLSQWFKATERSTGKKVILKGLIKRRSDERAMCEAGIEYE